MEPEPIACRATAAEAEGRRKGEPPRLCGLWMDHMGEGRTQGVGGAARLPCMLPDGMLYLPQRPFD